MSLQAAKTLKKAVKAVVSELNLGGEYRQDCAATFNHSGVKAVVTQNLVSGKAASTITIKLESGTTAVVNLFLADTLTVGAGVKEPSSGPCKCNNTTR